VQGAAYDLAVVISPLHGYHPASILTSSHLCYATPLGEIPVDQQVIQELNDQLEMISPYEITPISYDDEHSLEIELPFLQRALAKPFRLLPLMLRTREQSLIESLGSAIAQQISGKSALLVASSDLSHFYPAQIAENLDKEVLRQVEALSPQGVLTAESKGTGFACGAAAVATVLYAARKLGANKVKILHYSTSADETGDTHSVVGYGAAVVLKTE
jgi:AmmeMemoRadiSam system protein B